MANLFPTVTIKLHGHIAVITLNQSDTRNKIQQTTSSRLKDLCTNVQYDDNVWVIVITGSQDVFCAGTADDALTFGIQDSHFLNDLRVSDTIAAIEKPVVAAVNGDAIDQGLEIAMACDLRVASNEALFGLTQLEKNLIPWDGGTQRLPRLIGISWAIDMVLSSRVLSAEEAERIGLVNLVVDQKDVLSRAIEIATTISNQGPIATRYAKEAILKGQDLTLEQGMRLEADLSFLLHGTGDRSEGLNSFLARRPPTYRGN